MTPRALVIGALIAAALGVSGCSGDGKPVDIIVECRTEVVQSRGRITVAHAERLTASRTTLSPCPGGTQTLTIRPRTP